MQNTCSKRFACAAFVLGASLVARPSLAVRPDEASPEALSQVARALAPLRAALRLSPRKVAAGAPGSLEHAINQYAPRRAWRVDEGTLPAVLAAPLRAGACTADMRLLHGRICVDAYENIVLEKVTALTSLPNDERLADAAPPAYLPHPPYLPLEAGHVYLAVSQASVVPQAYISGAEAGLACAQAGKRLCSAVEWRLACGGSDGFAYPYGARRQAGYCNDAGRAVMMQLHADKIARGFGMTELNDPRINQEPGTLALTGSFANCQNDAGLFDMVGNLHEWTSDPNGTFEGGFYLDTHEHGDGCAYRTIAHGADYHDYSTGFRCCADPSATSAHASPAGQP